MHGRNGRRGSLECGRGRGPRHRNTDRYGGRLLDRSNRCRRCNARGRSWTLRSGRRRRWHVRQRRTGHRSNGVLGLLRGGSSGTSAQLFAGCFTRPGARINLTHYGQPLFGFGKCREVTHMKSEPLTPFLKASAHKECKALQLRQLRMGKGHRRSRRGQIQDKRARISGSGCRRFSSVRMPHGTSGQIWRN